MRVIVVGGGVGGLAAAVALGQEGFDLIVLEQAPELSEVGAGVNLSANAMKALVRLGVDSHIRETSVESEGNVYCSLEDGSELSRTEFGAAAAKVYGEGFYHTYRPDLL